MALQAYDKKDIALAQLEVALRLFKEAAEPELFAVITLAGAAEEILGKLVERSGLTNSFTSLAEATAVMHTCLFQEPGDEKTIRDRINRARNSLKHLDAGGGPTVTLDLREEAVDILRRAIDNYWDLEQSQTPAMEAFQSSQQQASS
jgi:hypothetical protein